ncbi:hypothetical protein Ancab_031085 [Ancistrocladus abbreviatus]
MATRRRATSNAAPKEASEAVAKDAPPSPAETQSVPSKWPKILTFSLLFLIPYLYLLFFHYNVDEELKRSIIINFLLSAVGFVLTLRLIPVASRYVFEAPESLGIAVGIVFLVLAILFQYFNFTADSIWLVEYNAALASVCFMILLGFVDDVLDVPWREIGIAHRLLLFPLLMAYAGHTTIIIPKPLIPYVGLEVLDLGWVYKLNMGLLAKLDRLLSLHQLFLCITSCKLEHLKIQSINRPMHSLFILYNLCWPLLWHYSLTNWYPSSVFVGDTYTYFAGMTMAVVGYFGSLQLAGIVPCPRHRLPRYCYQTQPSGLCNE